MKINKSVIEKLKPCKDRFDNYLKFYGDKEFTKAQFMGLKNITHDDKLWVAFKLLSKDQCVSVACDIAESVLHIFEEKYPNDKRPRLAIEAARSGDKDAAHEAARAAYRAARAAASDAARAAARAASDAASDAARAAYRAARAAARAAYTTRETQEKLIRKIILRYWK